MVLHGQKLVCVISGASRGIGRAIALEVGKRAGAGSTLLLLARNSARLDLVQHEITKQRAGEVTVQTSICDIGTATAAEFTQLLNDVKTKAGQVDAAYLIQNAATLGPGDQRASQLTDTALISNYMQLNFNSFVLLNSLFLQTFPSGHRCVVNISSGAAYRNLECFHLYAAAKAARDAFYRCVAAEEKGVRVLNYNPGPTITDMQHEIGDHAWSEELKQWSKKGTSGDGDFLKPEQAVEVLFTLLEEDKYESGTFFNAGGKELSIELK
uniref:Sepiapterin reductase n=1 Tax=Plectus sambesii TaxID=2011161 RepID=A0A914W307_9BILA